MGIDMIKEKISIGCFFIFSVIVSTVIIFVMYLSSILCRYIFNFIMNQSELIRGFLVCMVLSFIIGIFLTIWYWMTDY